MINTMLFYIGYFVRYILQTILLWTLGEYNYCRFFYLLDISYELSLDDEYLKDLRRESCDEICFTCFEKVLLFFMVNTRHFNSFISRKVTSWIAAICPIYCLNTDDNNVENHFEDDMSPPANESTRSSDDLDNAHTAVESNINIDNNDNGSFWNSLRWILDGTEFELKLMRMMVAFTMLLLQELHRSITFQPFTDRIKIINDSYEWKIGGWTIRTKCAYPPSPTATTPEKVKHEEPVAAPIRGRINFSRDPNIIYSAYGPLPTSLMNPSYASSTYSTSGPSRAATSMNNGDYAYAASSANIGTTGPR